MDTFDHYERKAERYGKLAEKYARRAQLAGWIVIACALALAALWLVGCTITPYVGQRVSWCQVHEDVNGNPEHVNSADIGIFKPVAPGEIGKPVAVANEVPPTGEYDPAQLFKGVPEGTYNVRVRMRDLNGNIGAWSRPSEIVLKDTVPPKPPRCVEWK